MAKRVREGSSLARESARRLSESASVLLEAGGDTGVVLGLWSLAVEALGQALLLDEQVRQRAPEEEVCVTPGFDHRRSLERGLADLPTLSTSAIARILRVSAHSEQPRVLEDPLSHAQVFVPAFATGEFADVTDGLDPPQASVELRFSLLYVGWDRASQTWTDGRLPLGNAIATASWELSRGDLRTALYTLDHRLRAA